MASKKKTEGGAEKKAPRNKRTTGEIIVAQGVPIPAIAERGAIYPFRALKKVGQSLLVKVEASPGTEEFTKEVENRKASIRAASVRYASRITAPRPKFVIGEVEIADQGWFVGCWLERFEGEQVPPESCCDSCTEVDESFAAAPTPGEAVQGSGNPSEPKTPPSPPDAPTPTEWPAA